MNIKFDTGAFGTVKREALYDTEPGRSKLIISAEIRHLKNIPPQNYVQRIVSAILEKREYEAEFAPLLKTRAQISQISPYPREYDNGDTLCIIIEISFDKDEPKPLVRDDGIYIVPVTWTMYSTIHVEADSLEDAVERAEAAKADLPLGEAEYLEDSYAICDISEAEEIFSYEDHGVPFRGVFLRYDGLIDRKLPD